MPTWGQLLRELKDLEKSGTPEGTSASDLVRRKYLARLSKMTGRAAIIYATDFLSDREDVGAQPLSISLGDIQGFMEAVSNVEERELDLIIHSPGGSPEAAESIVEYLRSRFDHIRAIVPVAAMSAATMISLAADEILMGSHSQLGPIDPQFTVFTPEGPRSAPGQAILDQFEKAKQECRDPQNIAGWLPLLRSLLPGLIAQCESQRELAEEVVADWLEKWMFADADDPKTQAKVTAAWFANFEFFKSHGRRVSRQMAREQKVKVTDLEEDQDLQDAVLTVHHAINHTFGMTGTTKIIENHHGRAFIQIRQQVALPFPVGPPRPGPPSVFPVQAPQAPQGNRAERRRQERERGKKK